MFGAWDAERKDPKCCRSYARRRITGAIQDELRRGDWSARRVNVDGKREYQRQSRPLYLEGALKPEEGIDYPLSYPDAQSPEELAAQRELVSKAIRCLTDPREIDVVYTNFFSPNTIGSLAPKYGVSEPMISVVLQKAIRRMARVLSDEQRKA